MRLRVWLLRQRVRFWVRLHNDRRIARAYDHLVATEGRNPR